MTLVLAIEPDSSQADPLSSVVCAKLGVELVVVTSAYAAIAAMNKRVPDLVLLGREVSEEQRGKIATHLRSLRASPAVPTLDIPQLTDPTAPGGSAFQNQPQSREQDAAAEGSVVALFAKQIDACLAEAEDVRMGAESDIIAADIMLIEAEVEFRLKAELERVRAQAAQEQSGHGSSQSQAPDRATLAAQVEEARREAAFAVAREREAEAARARVEADTARAAAIEEARIAAEAEAARRALRAEVARVKADTEAQVHTAVARARAESETLLREQVARATAETEARLEAQLASVRGEAEQVRHEHKQATLEAERIRAEAAEVARASAEAALTAETERIRAEAEERLEAEIAALRADAERRQAVELESIRTQAAGAAKPVKPSLFSRLPRVRWDVVRWDLVGAAAVLLVVVGTGTLWLPRVLSSAAKTSSSWAGTASKAAADAANKAASVAVAAGPSVKSALAKAEQVARREGAGAKQHTTTPANATPVTESEPVGPGFLVAFSRIPMDLYADGRRIGSTEDGELLLSAGTHRIQFVSERFHYRSTIAVTIQSGQVTPHTLSLPSGQLHVTTTPGAEVWIEGERVGVAPMDAIAIPIGTHEVVVKNPAGGERHQAVEVKYGATSELTIMSSTGNAEAQPTPRLAPLSQYQPKK